MEGTDEGQLKRHIGLPVGISLIVGGIIGSGIFVSPQGVTIGAGSYGMSLIIWAVCGLVSLCGALTYAEMGTRIPKSGSAYHYLRSLYGDWAGFVYMFTWIFFSLPTALAIVSLTFTDYFLGLFFNDGCGAPPGDVTNTMAALLIVTVALINAVSVVLAGRIAMTFTLAKLAALAVIVVGGIWFVAKGSGSGHLHPDQSWQSTGTSFSSLAQAMLSGMWAYTGWDGLNYVTEELKDPLRTLPRAISLSIPSVTVFYILTNMAYFVVLSPEELVSSSTVALTWANKLNPSLVWLISISVAVSTFGTANGAAMLNSRLPHVAAREGHMMEILGMVNVHYYTPLPAIILMATLAIIYTNLGTIMELIGYLGIVGWIFDGMVAVGVIILRLKKTDAERKDIYKVPLICPIVILPFAVSLSLGPVIGNPQFGYFFALSVIVAGLLTWLVFVKYKLTPPGLDAVTVKLQQLLHVVGTRENVTTASEPNYTTTRM